MFRSKKALSKAYAQATKGKRNFRKKKFRKASPMTSNLGMLGQQASISETLQISDVKVGTYLPYSFSLRMFQRASTLAPNFEYYKAVKVTYSYEPTYNTYQSGTGSSIPYMYTVMNRTQSQNAYNLNQLQAFGIKGQKFVSTKRITYRPNWCSQGMGAYTQNGTAGSGLFISSVNGQGLKAEYGWLNTPDALPVYDTSGNIAPQVTPILIDGVLNQVQGAPPNTFQVVPEANYTNVALYNGHQVWFDQDTPSTQDVAKVTITVTWVFRGPKVAKDLYKPPPSEEVVQV